MNSLEDLLEICLQRLQAGADLAVILAEYPEQADNLRPLLEAAREAFFLAEKVSVPAAAQSLSRSKFLTAAAAAHPTHSHKPVFAWLHWRLAISSMIVIGIFAAVLTATGLASAAALPGDVFYPVKRIVEQIQIEIVQDPPAKLELREKFDDRRLEEVTRLNEIQRREYVSFSGVLEKNASGRWVVGSQILDFPAGFSVPVRMIEKYVQVSGYSDTRVVTVEEIELRSYQWDGILQEMVGYQWVVSGVKITLDENSQVTGAAPQVGARVRVNTSRTIDNRYLMLSADVSPLPTPTSTRRVEKRAESTNTHAPVIIAKTPVPTEKREVEKITTVTPRATSTQRALSPTRTDDDEDDDKGDDKKSTVAPRKTFTLAPTQTRRPTETKASDRDEGKTPSKTPDHDDD